MSDKEVYIKYLEIQQEKLNKFLNNNKKQDEKIN